MGKPLSAAHKAAISKALKGKKHSGGANLGGGKLGGRKISNPASNSTPKAAPKPTRSATSADHAKHKDQVTKALRTRGEGRLNRSQVQDGLDMAPKDFDRAVSSLKSDGKLSASPKTISHGKDHDSARKWMDDRREIEGRYDMGGRGGATAARAERRRNMEVDRPGVTKRLRKMNAESRDERIAARVKMIGRRGLR